MADEVYINLNRTDTFKKGDKVVMHNCFESKLPEYEGKIWECQTSSFIGKGKQEEVFIKGFSGAFFCEYLQIVKP